MNEKYKNIKICLKKKSKKIQRTKLGNEAIFCPELNGTELAP